MNYFCSGTQVMYPPPRHPRDREREKDILEPKEIRRSPPIPERRRMMPERKKAPEPPRWDALHESLCNCFIHLQSEP